MKSTATRFLLVLSLALLAPGLFAEVDIPWGYIHQDAIEKTCKDVDALLAPFRASAGFPDQRPAGLENATWEQLYAAAAGKSREAAKLFAVMIEKFKLPIRYRLGAQYFQLRMQIGSRLQPGLKGHERAHEYLCRDFARACDRGLDELRFWRTAEPLMPFDMLWAKTVREGLGRFLSGLPKIPAEIAPGEAQKIWRAAATQAISAANEAGMTASRVGAFDFPAWRLRFAVKYFKAAVKTAVVDFWDSTRRPEAEWLAACAKLRQCVEAMPDEVADLLATLPKQ